MRRLSSQRGSGGFSVIELLIVVVVGAILTAIAVPLFNSAMTNMHMNSMASAISAAVSKTRYRAIMNSQTYVLDVHTPANTYIATNQGTGQTDRAVPFPSSTIAINGGTTATYEFTLCPNGMVYGAGGSCASAGNTTPPALSITYQGRQINISVSSVGNVTTTTIH
ncbi:MAG TPA: prepilin-type N-terminal cleavage/methylation domain-containing protein [Candidatus Acidoferrum sp.]|nr:prepilin-type N-terminal cleavage/methylation domain-containing protein [Candidatus Acidoferrum sp.]